MGGAKVVEKMLPDFGGKVIFVGDLKYLGTERSADLLIIGRSQARASAMRPAGLSVFHRKVGVKSL